MHASTPVELVAYDPSYAHATAQAFLEIFTMPPWNETVSLNDLMYQLESDYCREGFGGLLFTSGKDVIGFSWWFALSGHELYERWRPRFQPREKIPTPEGRGTLLAEFGVVPAARHRGLGRRLVQTSLQQIEPDYDWIAVTSQKFAHPALALLKSAAFVDLELTGIQVPTRICLFKYIR